MSSDRKAEKHLKEVNEARKLAGLPLLESKWRKCMRCDREFKSYMGERMCGCDVKND